MKFKKTVNFVQYIQKNVHTKCKLKFQGLMQRIIICMYLYVITS